MKKILLLLAFLGSFSAAFAQYEDTSLLEEIVIPIESAKKFYTIHSSRVINDSLLTRHNGTATDLLKRFASIHFKRSEEHTSELQSRENLVCRLLLEKKKL